MELGSFGVWTGGRTVAEADRPEVAQLAEQLGFVWHYEPEELAAEFAALDQEFPGRTLLGVGIAHPESVEQYARPLTKMSAFLDGLDRAAPPVPKERRCVAALGPKMLDLSAERSLGAHPYFTPVEHTRYARERLGPGPLVAPELACVVGEDPGRAAARAPGRLRCVGHAALVRAVAGPRVAAPGRPPRAASHCGNDQREPIAAVTIPNSPQPPSRPSFTQVACQEK